MSTRENATFQPVAIDAAGPATPAAAGAEPYGWIARLLRRQGVLYALSIVAGLLLWDLVARQFSGFILAPPTAVAAKLWQGIVSLELVILYVHSLGHMALGFVLAVIVAVPLGLLMGRNDAVYQALDPLVNAIYAIPIIAFVPFVIIWFGLFFEARVALVFLMCVFDMLLVVATGARNVDRQLLDVGRSFGASRWLAIRGILLPASLPFLFTATRIGLVRAVNAMITAELFLAAVNLGAFMKAAANRFDSASLLAVLLILCLTGLGLQEAIKRLEAYLLPWHVRT
jgi:NitT/TauT family transport system permease protein/sulfonate transport system permease protein